jgi:hypothetical protein
MSFAPRLSNLFSIGSKHVLPDTLTYLVFAFTDFADLQCVVFVARGCKEQVYRYLETSPELPGWSNWSSRQLVLVARARHLVKVAVPLYNGFAASFRTFLEVLRNNQTQLREFHQDSQSPGYRFCQHQSLLDALESCPRLERLFVEDAAELVSYDPSGFLDVTHLRLHRFHWSSHFLQRLCGNTHSLSLFLSLSLSFPDGYCLLQHNQRTEKEPPLLSLSVKKDVSSVDMLILARSRSLESLSAVLSFVDRRSIIPESDSNSFGALTDLNIVVRAPVLLADLVPQTSPSSKWYFPKLKKFCLGGPDGLFSNMPVLEAPCLTELDVCYTDGYPRPCGFASRLSGLQRFSISSSCGTVFWDFDLAGLPCGLTSLNLRDARFEAEQGLKIIPRFPALEELVIRVEPTEHASVEHVIEGFLLGFSGLRVLSVTSEYHRDSLEPPDPTGTYYLLGPLVSGSELSCADA